MRVLDSISSTATTTTNNNNVKNSLGEYSENGHLEMFPLLAEITIGLLKLLIAFHYENED